MNLNIAIVEIDCADTRLVAGFWAAALGVAVEFEAQLPDGPFIRLEPAGKGQPSLGFHQVPEPRPVGKNRVHIDLGGGVGYAAEIDRLVGLGASVVAERHSSEYNFTWTVLADPRTTSSASATSTPRKGLRAAVTRPRRLPRAS